MVLGNRSSFFLLASALCRCTTPRRCGWRWAPPSTWAAPSSSGRSSPPPATGQTAPGRKSLVILSLFNGVYIVTSPQVPRDLRPVHWGDLPVPAPEPRLSTWEKTPPQASTPICFALSSFLLLSLSPVLSASPPPFYLTLLSSLLSSFLSSLLS